MTPADDPRPDSASEAEDVSRRAPATGEDLVG